MFGHGSTLQRSIVDKSKTKDLNMDSPLSKKKKFKSHTCPFRARLHNTCSLTGVSLKFSFPFVLRHFLMHPSLISVSPCANKPESSWLVICDLPVCGCNKVSAQLRIHFPATNTTNQGLESLGAHTQT